MDAESVAPGRVVLGGSTGFIGQDLARRWRAEGREVVTVSRRGADLTWDDQDGIDAAVDGADLVVGLAGKSVNCRYTPANRAEILRSRIETTAALRTTLMAPVPKRVTPSWILALFLSTHSSSL